MISATITQWEDGTDLVLDTHISADLHTVWKRIASPMECALWFAPFHPVEDSEEERADGTAEAEGASEIDFDFDGSPLRAQVLSCAEDDHVLIELGGLGRISVRLTDDDGVTVTVAHTYANDAEAAQLIPQVGPVWDTHLRLLAQTFEDEQFAEAETEEQLYARYEELVAAELGDAGSETADGEADE